MYPARLNKRCASNTSGRSAFTLVELLVVVSIIIALTTITVMSVNFSISADRMRAGARQIQSLIAGARDRAIYAKDIRGIRLIRDPNDNHSVNAIQYVGAPGKVSAGTLAVVAGSDGTTIDTTGTGPSYFTTLKNVGLIRIGSRIQIPKNTGRWYTIVGFPSATTISISQKYADFNTAAIGSTDFGRTFNGLTYSLELQPQPLPDSPPVQLPKGVVIDLDGSQVPSNWRPVTFLGAYSNQMDILFSAKGLPVGDVVSLGMIHLHIADAGDVVKWQQIGGRNLATYLSTAVVPADDPSSAVPVVTQDRILVTLTTRTGNVSVHPVNPTNMVVTPTSPIENQKIADDPFAYAETGEVATK